jgi:signal transduction histidine kinase/PAS domain-containing protein
MPGAFFVVLALAYGFGLGLAWFGRLRESALWVSGVFWMAILCMYWVFPVTGYLVVALITILLVFVSTFLDQRAVMIFIILSGVSYTLVALIQINALIKGGAALEAPLLGFLMGLLTIVLASAVLWLNNANNKNRSLALQAQEQRYRALFESSPVALWEEDASLLMERVQELDWDGVQDFRQYISENPAVVAELLPLIRVTGVNQTAVSMFKASDKTALMDNLVNLVPAESYSFLLDSLVAMVERKSFFEREITNITLTGERITVLFRWSVPPGMESTYSQVVISILDITERKRIEKALQHYSDRLRGLHELDMAINVKNSPEEIAQVALPFICQFVPCCTASVWMFDMSDKTAVLLAVDAKGPELLQSSMLTPQSPLAAVISQEILDDLLTGSAYVVEDIWQMRFVPPVLAELKNMGQHSFIQAPLTVQGELIGCLSLSAEDPNVFVPEHIGIVQEIAAPVAIAISNARLRIAENSARIQAETLRQVAADLNASLDLEQLLGNILDQLVQVIDYDSATVYMEQDDSLMIVAQRGLPESILPEIQQAVAQFANVDRVYKLGEPYIVADTLKDPDWVGTRGSEYIRCWMGIPLHAKGKTIGLLSLDKSVAKFYTEQNAVLTVAFANQAAVAIENARLYKEARQYAKDLEYRVDQRTRDLSMLYRVTAVASKYLDLNLIMKESLQATLETLGYAGGAIHLLEEGLFKLHIQQNVPPQFLPAVSEFMTSFWLPEQILSQPKPTVLTDLASIPAFDFLHLPAGVFNYAGTAMRAKGEVMGILSVVHLGAKQFSLEDLDLLASVADHMGVAVENGRLRQKTQQMAVLEERERLARELHDSVTQSLYSLTLFAEAAQDLAQGAPGEKLHEYLNDISVIARQGLKEMRLMLYELRSGALMEEGLVKALHYRLETVETRSGMEASIEAPPDLEIPPELGHPLYRVAQEALNNILKHAKATAVFIRLSKENNTILMSIQDNGHGFTPPNSGQDSGLGLKNMKNRIEEVGGAFHISFPPGSGTRIEVAIPLEPSET